jgi:arsenate reductase-like glutaredoxin family protein
MAAARITLYQKPTCTTCRKAKALLQELRIVFASHDLDKERLSETELDRLIGSRDHKGS